ncbi:hypothetical protein B0A48_13182 [Cryoendolithus antarcticus]|uniref:BTB domain-containing protein n=1 Tax=Cryoendolithus antarcticus TaxID=1507870 RepID=A0A1V8SP71_9PEZI|nr:hypothetical protein B0A48_13182 [Cryoendolithus antarcticus]
MSVTETKWLNNPGVRVAVLIGPSGVPCKVHEDLICKTSKKFFRAACSERWAVSGDRIVRLVDEESAAFRLYIEWIYTKDIDFEENTLNGKFVTTRAIEAFLLENRPEDVKYRNYMILQLHDSWDEASPLDLRINLAPTQSDISTAYDHTLTKSVLRKVLVDSTVAFGRPGWFTRYDISVHPEFQFDFALASMEVMEEDRYQKRRWLNPRRNQHFEVDRDRDGGRSSSDPFTRQAQRESFNWERAAQACRDQYVADRDRSDDSDDSYLSQAQHRQRESPYI